MSNAPFLRPMVVGFAVTATAILAVPMRASAQTASAVSQCAAPAAPKPHGLKLGRLLAAAQNSGAMPFPGGRGLGLSVAASLASSAIDAATNSQAEAGHQAATPACTASDQ